jgi:hypothetical protein
VAASPGLGCELLGDLVQFPVACDPDFGICAIRLFFAEDPTPGTEYSLGAFFAGCEENGRCGGFTAGDPEPNCGGSNRLLNFRPMMVAPEALRFGPATRD